MKYKTFENFNIFGTPEKMAEIMIKEGYSLVEKLPHGNIALKGEFAEIPNCLIILYESDTFNLVDHIGIFLPDKQTWPELKSDYFNYKKDLSDRYEIFESKEEFCDEDGALVPESMENLRKCYCTYSSGFFMPGKVLWLSIDDTACISFMLFDF